LATPDVDADTASIDDPVADPAATSAAAATCAAAARFLISSAWRLRTASCVRPGSPSATRRHLCPMAATAATI